MVTSVGHEKVRGQPQRTVTVPSVLRPLLLKNPRRKFPVGLCLATQGGSRKLSQAARDYAAGIDVLHKQRRRITGFEYVCVGTGVRKGIDEDDLVALQLGKTRAEELTNVQQKYKDKLKQRLAEVPQQNIQALSAIVVANLCVTPCCACRKLSCSERSRRPKTNSSLLAS